MDRNLPKQTVSNFTQTIFDKAFIKIVETLIHRSNVDDEPKLTRKDLLAKMYINESSYQKIKTKQRGVPVDKIPAIRKILLKDYGVDERYLKTLEQPMFDTGGINNMLNEPQAQYITTQYEIALLKKDVQSLKQIIEEKDKMLEQKDTLINVLNEALKLSREK